MKKIVILIVFFSLFAAEMLHAFEPSNPQQFHYFKIDPKSLARCPHAHLLWFEIIQMEFDTYYNYVEGISTTLSCYDESARLPIPILRSYIALVNNDLAVYKVNVYILFGLCKTYYIKYGTDGQLPNPVYLDIPEMCCPTKIDFK